MSVGTRPLPFSTQTTQVVQAGSKRLKYAAKPAMHSRSSAWASSAPD